MSKLKVQGNASGTGVFTLETPATNTDRTITLPDADITLGSGPTHTSSGTAPSSPTTGDFWHDTTNDRLYIRTNDGSSDIWLQI